DGRFVRLLAAGSRPAECEGTGMVAAGDGRALVYVRRLHIGHYEAALPDVVDADSRRGRRSGRRRRHRYPHPVTKASELRRAGSQLKEEGERESRRALPFPFYSVKQCKGLGLWTETTFNRAVPYGWGAIPLYLSYNRSSEG